MSLSVSDMASVLAQVEALGGSVVEGAASEHFAMIRDPDGQLTELLPDTWLANLPPKPESGLDSHYMRSGTVNT